MPDTPAVSVVLPVYNRESLVRRAIDSVIGQTFQDFELIVVDDSSTDGTPSVLSSYLRDPRISVHRTERNLGPAGARNLGIRRASARYIAFQDSDDRWFPEKLERQLAVLRTTPSAEVCYCGALYYAREQCYYIPIPQTVAYKSGDLSRQILFGNPTTPQTLVVSRDLLLGVGLFNEELEINEDWDLAIRLAQKTAFAFVDDPLAIIYRTPNSISSHQLKDARFREWLLERYGEMFSRNRDALSRQHYIAGSVFLKNGACAAASRHFLRAFQLSPGPRPLAQLLRTFVLNQRSANAPD